jgi:hypothetical protein
MEMWKMRPDSDSLTSLGSFLFCPARTLRRSDSLARLR